VRDCERLPGHHKTYIYGSVVHVMTAWIARRQSRHHRQAAELAAAHLESVQQRVQPGLVRGEGLDRGAGNSERKIVGRRGDQLASGRAPGAGCGRY
jgi:hypothetical protein